jgi:hypothetical protein
LPSEKDEVEWVICPAACQVEPLSQFGLFQQHDVRSPSLMGEVIGEADPHDAAADDDDAGVGGKFGHGQTPFSNVSFDRLRGTNIPSSIMNGTNVSSAEPLEPPGREWETLTPEAQKAARYVLENPNEVGVSTVREIAEAAKVKPNTVRAHGAPGGLRRLRGFPRAVPRGDPAGAVSFPDRARWLQDCPQIGDLGGLYADMVEAARSRNLEETFAGIDAEALKAAAEAIWAARRCYTLGVGVNNSNARNFTYLASTGMVSSTPSRAQARHR